MMLSGASRAPAPRRRRGASPVLAQAAGADLRFMLAGEAATALAEGALWLEAHGVLVVSDLHLEKGSAYARGGQLLPPYDTAAALARLAALVARLGPQTVVSLGDSFHDVGGPDRMAPADTEALAELVGRVDWVWIEGNHDPALPARLGGRAMEALSLGRLRLRHEPQPAPAPGEVAGHLHPCAKAVARGRAVRARCFATDGERLVMPAFGAYAGGLNVRDAAFDPLFPGGLTAFILGRERLYPAPCARLAGDG